MLKYILLARLRLLQSCWNIGICKSHQNSYEMKKTLQVEDLVFSMTIKGDLARHLMDVERGLLISKLSFWPSRIIGGRRKIIMQNECVMLWKTEQKSWEIFTGSMQSSRRMKKMSSSFSVKMSNRKWLRFLHRSICMRMKLNFL